MTAGTGAVAGQAGAAAPASGPAFGKYAARGAYHWLAHSRHPGRHDCFTAERYRLVLDALGPALADDARVTDLGCGDGALAWRLARRVPRGRVTAVEPEPVGRALAAERLGARGVTVDVVADAAAVPDGSQDAVVCAEVIEHVHEPVALLGEIRRMLRPGGVAVLTTPVRLTERPLDREHVREFFPDEFAALVRGTLALRAHALAIPVFAVELYYWRPAFLLRRGVIRWTMNVLSAWCGAPVLRRLPSLGRYYLLQVAVGVRD